MNDDKNRMLETKELEAIGLRIRNCRKLLNVQQKVMAKALEISPSYFNAIESSKYYASAEILLKLSKIYNMSVEYLVTGRGEPFYKPQVETVEKEFTLKGEVNSIEKLLWLINKSGYAKMAILTHATFLVLEQGEIIKNSMNED